MQEDFHYYGTYSAAYLAGYSHEESLEIAYAAQLVDLCSVTLLKKLKAPRAAATTQLQSELINHRLDPIGLQDMTRIWASFHFLPYDLYADHKVKSKLYLDKYRMICKPNGKLVEKTVALAKGKSLSAAGLAMHILADTWAHAYFAGTPSLVINNTSYHFYERIEDAGKCTKRKINFNNNPGSTDDLEKSSYTNSLFTTQENSVMNLGHGRAGHLPDYSFIRYEYMPAWGDYDVIVKDNPSDYYHAFCQMIRAMRYLRGDEDCFELDQYAFDLVEPWEKKVREIIECRRADACEAWKELGESLSGREIPAFDLLKYQEEYVKAGKNQKNDTYLGQFILSAMAQKSMVTGEIFRSGNLLAGFAVDFNKMGFKGMRDFRKLATQWMEDKRP